MRGLRLAQPHGSDPLTCPGAPDFPITKTRPCELHHKVRTLTSALGTEWDPRQSFRPGATRTPAAEPQFMALRIAEPGRFKRKETKRAAVTGDGPAYSSRSRREIWPSSEISSVSCSGGGWVALLVRAGPGDYCPGGSMVRQSGRLRRPWPPSILRLRCLRSAPDWARPRTGRPSGL